MPLQHSLNSIEKPVKFAIEGISASLKSKFWNNQRNFDPNFVNKVKLCGSPFFYTTHYFDKE